MTDYPLPPMVQLISQSQQRGNAAVTLFNAARATAQNRRLWAALTHHPNTLRSLAQDHPRAGIGHSGGSRTVKLDAVRGSENRVEDFDDRFYPLSDKTRQRWQSVANALEVGLPLPPVQLVQLGDVYYVRDGHHRVSVNRALGYDTVEAEVTVWGN